MRAVGRMKVIEESHVLELYKRTWTTFVVVSTDAESLIFCGLKSEEMATRAFVLFSLAFFLVVPSSMSFTVPANQTRSYFWDNDDDDYLILCFPVVDENNATFIPAWRRCCRYHTYEQQKRCDDRLQANLGRKWKIAGIVMGSIGLLVLLCCIGVAIVTWFDTR